MYIYRINTENGGSVNPLSGVKPTFDVCINLVVFCGIIYIYIYIYVPGTLYMIPVTYDVYQLISN